MTPNHLELKSADGTKLNLEALYQIAPSCFTEVKDEKTGELRHVVNFTTLRQLLGDDAVDDAPEMYQFTWPGKQEARREAARPITDTLRPCPEESVDWDTTQNLYIEGDNLAVLKLLQKGYMGKVKMIYIDPPYNTICFYMRMIKTTLSLKVFHWTKKIRQDSICPMKEVCIQFYSIGRLAQVTEEKTDRTYIFH